ncbi:MAG: beta strand repeat-containing protein, partial [Planctomycetia bacterium]
MLSVNVGDGTDTFTFVTPRGLDVIALDMASSGVGQISGTSDGAAFEIATFTNYRHVVINAATHDTPLTQNDRVRIGAALSIAGLESLTILTGAGRDTIDLAGLSGTETFAITVEGGADDDTLVGATVSSLRSSWIVTGSNAGSIDARVTFTGVENLTGATGVVDRFTIAPAGRLDGSVTGQPDDGDSLSVQLLADAAAQSLTHLAAVAANAGSVSRNGVTVASYSGISSQIGLEFTATSAADAIRITRGATAGTLDVTSTNPIATFGGLTVSQTERTAFRLDADAGDDSITITASAVDAVLEGGELSIIGNTGTNTLTSLAAKNAWNIESANAGRLGDRILFTAIRNLVGGDGDDSFNFADAASLTGTVDGGGGHNTLDYSACTSAIAVNVGTGAVTGAAAALHFDRVIGGSGIDTLTGPSTNTVWRVTDENAGRLSRNDATVLDFAGVENLTGAATDRDVFIIEQDGSIAGMLTGSAAGWAGLLVQSVTDDSYTIVNAQTGGGQQAIALHGKEIAFVGLNPLVRPTSATAATFRAGDVAGGFALGDGANGTLRFMNVNGQFYDVATATLVTAIDVAKPSSSLSIVLGDADTGIILDTLTSPPAIGIQAGSGLNSLYANDVAHTWTISGANAGSVTGYDAFVAFSGIGTLVGGTADDTFIFANNAARVDGIDGGTSGTDTLDYSSVSTGVAVVLGIGNVNIDAVIGGSGIDTLVGVTDDNAWQVTGTNTGSVATTRVGTTTQISNVSFNGFENLVGNVSKDDFSFADGGSVAGFVDGAAGTNTLDFHLRTTAVTMNLGAASAGATTAIDGGARNMTAVIGTGQSDTLLGPDVDATWEITGANAGSIDRVRFDVNGVPFFAAVSFTGFENLTGAIDVDDGFIVRAEGGVAGTIAGGSDLSGELAVEDPQHPGTIAIVKPGVTGAGTIATNAIYAGRQAITFAGMQDPFRADTSVAGVLTLRGSMFGGGLTVSQQSGDIVVTNTSSTQAFWDYSSGNFVENKFTTGIGSATRVEVDAPGSVTVESLDLPSVDLRVSLDGDYVFAGNVSTHGGNIVVRLPNPRNNETANNTSGTITVNPGVILSTRQTNVLGASTDSSGSIDFLANRITIGAGAQLVSHDDRTVNGQPLLTAAGIPLTLGSQSRPTSAWMPGRVYRDIPTTGGSGTGLRVDVTTDNDGIPTVTLRTPGSGYAVGNTITVAEPNEFLTGSSSFRNGSPVTLTVTSLQKAGGDISLVARHHAQAIAWSFNPIDVGVSIAEGAVVKGRSVSIVADADNDVLFDGSKDPMGLSQAFSSPASFNSYLQQKLESVLDFLINFRLFVGVSLSKATASVTLAASSTVEAVGGNVLTEAFANSKAKGFTLGFGYGFSYGRSEATATVDARGTVRADVGAARLNSITGNTIDVTQKTTNTGALTKAKLVGGFFKMVKSAGDMISISGAVTEATSRAATTVSADAIVTATDVSIGSFGVKNVSTTVDASSENGKLGVCFLVTLDDATATTNVDGEVTATAGDVDIAARMTSETNSTTVKFQLGQPVRSDLANKVTAGIQLTRAIADGVAGSDDTAAAAGGLLGAGIKYVGDKNLTKAATKAAADGKDRTTVDGSSHGVLVGSIGFHANSATAQIGGTAVVTASDKVRVRGDALDRPVSLAQGLAAVFNDGVNVVTPGERIVGIAFDYGEYDNHSQAVVASGAVIDAGGAIEVAAHTLLPYETPWSTLNTQDSWTTGWQIPARILQHLGSDNLGANLYFSTFTQSTAIGNKKGYALSGTVRAVDSGATARIESGAMINQANQANPITASRNVSVTARTDVQTVNLVGNFPQILDVALGQAERKKQLANSGEASGWGGSFSAVLYDSTTQAVIESGARIRAHDLVVDADTLVKNVSVGISGGKAGETAVNGVVNHVGIDNVTLAQIGQGAVVTATGKVDVTADDTPLVVNLAGGVAIGTSTGVGITVGSTVVTRDTKALVGSNSTTLGDGTFTPGTGVDATADTIDLGYAHGYANGDHVVYSNGGDDSIGGLADGQAYEVVRVNATAIRLKTLTGDAVPLSAPAPDAGVRHTLGRVFSPATAITGTSPATVDAINLGYAHGLHTGDAVVYGNGGGTSIGGLAHKTTYSVIVVNTTTIRLAESLAKAQRGEWIDLDASVAAGTNHSIAIAFRAAPVVDAAADTIAFPNAGGFHDGQKVVYRNGGGTSIGGLTDGAAYYVTRVDGNRIRLSTNANDRAGSIVALDPSVATGSGHALVDPSAAAASLDVIGKTTVAATNAGQFITVTLAAAKVGDPPPTSDDALSAEAPGGQKRGQAVSGSVSVNTIDDTTVAEIRGVSITQSGGVAVSSEHAPSIVAISGGAAISTNSSNSARNVGLAGAVTVNVIDADTRATIVDSTFTDAGTVSVAATGSAAIVSIAAGLGGSSRGSGIAGSVAVNSIESGAVATVASSTIAGTSLAVNGTDGSSIITVAGALAGGGKLGVGAGIAVNTIDATAHAMVSSTTVDVTGTLDVTATGSPAITAVAAGVAVVIASPSTDPNNPDATPGTTRGLAVAIGLAVNSIALDVQASLTGDGTNTVSAGSVAVVADDAGASIVAVAGGVAFGVSTSEKAGATAGAGGAAFAVNRIDVTAAARITDIVVTTSTAGGRSGDVTVRSHSDAEIRSYAVGGAVAGAGGGGAGGSWAIAGAGALTFNDIARDVTAKISGTSRVTTPGTSRVTVTAIDESTIVTVAGGISIAVGVGGQASALGISVGASIASNTIKDRTATGGIRATVAGAAIAAGGDITVQASSTGTVTVTAFAGALAVSGSGGSTAAAASGAGASAENTITSTVLASIENTPGRLPDNLPRVRSQGGSIVVTASDDATIDATAVGASISVAAGTKLSGALAIGVSIARNRIDSDVAARLLDADVAAGQTVAVTGTGTADVSATSVAASVSFANGASGVSLAGGGSESTNVILSGTTATIANSVVAATGDVALTSTNSAVIHATVVSASLALGFGKDLGVGVAVGAAVSRNMIGYDDESDVWIPADVQATARNSTIEAGNDLMITAAADRQRIDATVVAAAAAIVGSGGTGFALAGSGVNVENSIGEAVRASIEYVPNVARTSGPVGAFEAVDGFVVADVVTVSASDSSSIEAVAVGASLAGSYGTNGALGIAIGASIAHNEIRNTVTASIVDADRNSTDPALVGVTARDRLAVSATESGTVSASAVAASVAAAFSAAASVGLSGAGADATNVILTKTNASIEGSRVSATAGVSIVAANSADIDATIVGVAVGVGVGASTGVGAAIGVALARNFIGWELDAAPGAVPAAETRAFVRNSTIVAGGALTLSATSSQTIDATVLAGSVAIAGGNIGVGIGGAGASSINKAAMAVHAFIDGDGVSGIRASSVSVHASDTSVIDVYTGAASIAGSYGNTAVSVAIGVSLARNEIGNDVVASILNADQGVTTTSGDILVTATGSARIRARSQAAAIAVAVGNIGAGVSGAGAEATNVILTKTNAAIDSSVLRSAGNVSLDATSNGQVIANVLAAAVGIGGGGAGGLGISIGASLAQNLIGWKAADDATPVPAEVRSTVSSSSISAAGTLEQTATGAAGIDAAVFAGSVAISTGTLGASLGGAGASSLNKIATRIEATIDGNRTGGIRATSIDLEADDASVIVASTGSAALAASFTGTGGLSLAIGVGLAENRITNQVTSGIRAGADVSTDARFTTASGTQTVTAGDRVRVDAGYVTPAFTTDSGVRTVSPGQRVELLAGFDEAALDTASGNEELYYGTTVRVLGGYTGGGSPGVYRYVGAAGTVSLGSENYADTARWARLGGTAGSVYAYVGTPGLLDLAGQNYADPTRWAKVGGQPNALYRYVGTTGAIDLATQDYGDASRWVAVASGGVTITASETAVIKATAQAASAAAGASFGAGVSLSGAGADATNSIANKVNAVVTGSSLTSAGDVSIAATDSSAIDARVASLSVAVAGGSVGIGLAIGASTAENTIGNGAADRAQVRALVTASAIDSSGDLDITARSTAMIAASVDAISAAVAGGGVGLAGSAAGTSVVNTVSIQVHAAIAGSSANGGVHADGGITLGATDTSSITASGLAASVAASVGAISGALAIGVALAENEISNDVEAFVSASTVTTSSGSLAITATESATISSSAQAAAVAISNGPAFSGGGADVTGTITTTVKAYVETSTVTLGGGLTISTADTSRATAEVRTTSVAAGGLGFAAAGSTSSVTVSPTLASTVSGSTIIAAGDVAVAAVSKAYGKALSEGNSFGTTFATGGSVATSTIAPSVTTSITGGSVTSTGGGISLVSRFNAADDGSNASTAQVPLGGIATAEASAGSLLLGGGGGRATSTTAGSIAASAGGSLSAATGISVLSVSYARPEAEGKGLAVGGLAGIGIALANATSRTTTSAAVTGSVTKAASLAVQSIAMQAPIATTTAVSGGIVAGNGSEATATVENQAADKAASAASLGSGSITVSGAVSLTATYRTGASAEAKGGAYGGVGVGASIATTRVGGDVAATVADNATITAGSLAIIARRQLPGDASSDGAYANATASAGGLIGVTGSSATAAATGKVTAATGSNVSLPIGTVTISARNETRQHAKATGKAGGIVAVGSNSADAT